VLDRLKFSQLMRTGNAHVFGIIQMPEAGLADEACVPAQWGGYCLRRSRPCFSILTCDCVHPAGAVSRPGRTAIMPNSASRFPVQTSDSFVMVGITARSV
jgi:hypothetical protein